MIPTLILILIFTLSYYYPFSTPNLNPNSNLYPKSNPNLYPNLNLNLDFNSVRLANLSLIQTREW